MDTLLSKPRLLCVGKLGKDEPLLDSQLGVFTKYGYPWLPAHNDLEVQHAIQHSAFDIAVLNHTLSQDERQRYAQQIKSACPEALIMVLHASGAAGSDMVDAAVDSRTDPAEIVHTVELLRQMMQIRNHDHEELRGEYAVAVDKNRHYTFVSEGASRLLGYTRAEMVGRQIEDIVYPRSADVEHLFQRFVDARNQQGSILLRHRTGAPILVDYTSTAYDDGCLVARWSPVNVTA